MPRGRMDGMESVRTLIAGAGMSGLATAAFSRHADYLVLEGDAEIGGYCKTVKRDGFVWDYSGHFFHFKHPEIEAWLRERMPGQEMRTVDEALVHPLRRPARSTFPFQKNIHQLPQDEFIECLHDLYFARAPGARTRRRPRATSRRCSTRASAAHRREVPDPLQREALRLRPRPRSTSDAMGRFFPHADLTDIIRNMKAPDNATLQRDVHVSRGRRDRVREGAGQRGAAGARSPSSEPLVAHRPRSARSRARRSARSASSASSRRRRSPSSLKLARRRARRGASSPGTRCWSSTSASTRRGRRGVHWIYYPDRALLVLSRRLLRQHLRHRSA